MAKHELLVFVDSDSFLNPFAIRNLVQPFQDPKMGAFQEEQMWLMPIQIFNKNAICKILYSFSYNEGCRIIFDTVTCLSDFVLL